MTRFLLRFAPVVVASVAVAAFDYARHVWLPGRLHVWPGSLFMLVAVFLVTWALGEFLLWTFRRERQRMISEVSELAQKRRLIESLYQATASILNPVEAEDIARAGADAARAVVGADVAVVCLAPEGERSGHHTVVASLARGVAPLSRDALNEVARACPLSAAQRATDGSFTIGSQVACPLVGPEWRKQLLAVPLNVRGRFLGTLCLMSQQETRWTPEDVRAAAELASRIAVAVENARLHRHAREMAVLEERDRIAREMHDSLAQVLGFLSMKAKALLSKPDGKLPGTVWQEIREMAQISQDAYVDVREAILGLRESVVQRGLLSALTAYVRKFERQSGLRVDLRTDSGAVAEYSPQAEVQLIRVIQEALTNARKHARAHRVTVTLGRENGTTVIAVEDDGRGFDVDEALGRGFGLLSMRERVEEVGGTLEVVSAPQRGTRIVARVPLAGRSGGAPGA